MGYRRTDARTHGRTDARTHARTKTIFVVNGFETPRNTAGGGGGEEEEVFIAELVI